MKRIDIGCGDPVRVFMACGKENADEIFFCRKKNGKHLIKYFPFLLCIKIKLKRLVYIFLY